MSEAPLDLERGEVTELLAEEEPQGARVHYTSEQLDRDRELIRRAFELALHQERSQYQSRLQVDPPVDWVLLQSLPMCEEYQQVVRQLQPPHARQAGIEVKSKDEEKEDDPRKAPEEEAEFEEGDAVEELEEGVAAVAEHAMPKESSGATSTETSEQQSQDEGPRPSGIQERSSVSAGEAVGETRRDPTEKDAGEGGEEPTDVMAKELGQDTEDGRQGAPSPPESLPDEEESLEGTDGSQSEDTQWWKQQWRRAQLRSLLREISKSAEEEEDVGEGGWLP